MMIWMIPSNSKIVLVWLFTSTLSVHYYSDNFVVEPLDFILKSTMISFVYVLMFSRYTGWYYCSLNTKRKEKERKGKERETNDKKGKQTILKRSYINKPFCYQFLVSLKLSYIYFSVPGLDRTVSDSNLIILVTS